MTLEEISGGREPRRWVRAAALVLALVLGGALLANSLVRRSERSALRACVTAAESDLDDLAYRTAGLEVYIASTVDRPDVAPSVKASLRGIVQETVLRALPSLERDQRRCRATRTWHPSARAARNAYVAYLDARLDQVQRAVEDLDAWHEVVPAIGAARAKARAALGGVGVTLSP